jgi:hypothetical protein
MVQSEVINQGREDYTIEKGKKILWEGRGGMVIVACSCYM